MAQRLRRRVALPVTAAVGLTALLAPATTAFAKAPAARHTVSAAPAWTALVTPSGKLPGSTTVHAKVWLAPRDQAGLDKLVAAVSDPASPQYGQSLTAADYLARFAPTGKELAAVSSWLAGAGLKVEGTGPSNHFLAVAGSPAAVQSAFGAELDSFTVDGTTAMAPVTAVTVPDGVAANVLAVTGLDTLAHWAHPNTVTGDSVPDAKGSNNGHRVNLGPTGGFVNSDQCSTYWGEKAANGVPAYKGQTLPYAPCGYTPSQLRSAYGVDKAGATGKGVTVAITDAFASPTLAKDANTYATTHGDPGFAQGQFEQRSARGYDPQRVGDCGGNGWYGEQTLDVEAVHAMALDAKVAYYGAASCYDDDLLAAMAQVVTDDQASLVSNSWGEPMYVTIPVTDPDTQTTAKVLVPVIDDSLVKAYESVLEQGAAQQIGFYFSSGDGGDDAGYGVQQVDWPTADPYVTSVGGTSLGIDEAGKRVFETGWETAKATLKNASWTTPKFIYGAGGGCFTGVDYGTRTLPDGAFWDNLKADLQAAEAALEPDFAKPGWQGDVTGCTNRGIPDIAMLADPTTGMLVGETQMFAAPTRFGKGVKYGEYRIGGTSLASPLTAGLNAVAQEGRSRIGWANPALYTLYKNDSSVFYDVATVDQPGAVRVDYQNGLNDAAGVAVSLRTFNDASSLTAKAGWDDVSGLGSPTTSYIQALHDLR